MTGAMISGHRDRAGPASTRSSRWSASCSSSPRWCRCRSSSAPTTSVWTLVPFMLLLGLGLGFNFQPVILAVQNAVSPARDGRGHLVGDLLPADGRHDRGRGLPVDPVHHAAAPRSATRYTAARARRRSRRPRAQPASCSAEARQPALARHLGHPRPATRLPGDAVQDRLLEHDRPGVPGRGRRGRGDRLLRADASCRSCRCGRVGHPGRSRPAPARSAGTGRATRP